jgi:hypothetical protein
VTIQFFYAEFEFALKISQISKKKLVP